MSNGDKGRREFLEWASGIGLLGIAPQTIADIASAEEGKQRPNGSVRVRPDPVPDAARGDPDSPVQTRHPLTSGRAQERIERFQQEQRPEILYKQSLVDEIERSDDDRQIPIAVKTVGQSVSITSDGPRRRRIDGWRPQKDEVRELGKFGSVEHVPDFISTKVSMRDVRIADLEQIAKLPHVIEINYDPDATPDSVHYDKSTLRSNEVYWFESVEDDYSISWPRRVAILDDGYQEGEGAYETNHAAEIGHTISSRDFTDEDDWSNVTYESDGEVIYHGTTVADSVGYMIDPEHGERTHDNLFAHFKVASESQSFWASTVRSAIEHAMRNDIPVINMSFSSSLDGSYCSSQFCDSLQSYVAGGYIPLASTSNDNDSQGVGHPGSSAWDIAVGGFVEGDDHDFVRASFPDDDPDDEHGSNYGYIRAGYYDSRGWFRIECDECFERIETDRNFYPDVYGCYATRTNSDGTAGGTSNATPQVAAAALIMQENQLYDFDQARNILNDMNYYAVEPDEAAEEGQVVDAFDAYYSTL